MVLLQVNAEVLGFIRTQGMNLYAYIILLVTIILTPVLNTELARYRDRWLNPRK
jgi:hypothetical protein